MKKLIFVVAAGFVLCSSGWAASLKLTPSASAEVEGVGNENRPGLLFKFELPSELQKARIDIANLRFQVQSDTLEKAFTLLVRPMLVPWTAGLQLANLSDSASSPFHVSIGRIGGRSGTGKVQITQLVRAWQSAEIPNFGVLVYPAEQKADGWQLRNLSDGGVAELEIQYTAQEVKR